MVKGMGRNRMKEEREMLVRQEILERMGLMEEELRHLL
jgi:hypothetical protein